MEYGCIGEKLGHSFSSQIHGLLADYKYELCEIERDKLDAFMTERNFKAINVTIPYKEAVIRYLSKIDDAAKSIGAVNTVVNRGGELFGYNTDFYGLTRLIERSGICIKDKSVAVLGTGGTSKTAVCVAKSFGAKEVFKVSRKSSPEAVSYAELYENHLDTEIIINTTPVGMYPNVCGAAVDVSKFPKLCGVIDAVYNPQRTDLVLFARELGIPAVGGLYMLVAQAVRASEIFTDTKYPEGECDRIYELLSREKENIVLIGMPSSGKSTVGKILNEKLHRELIDTDSLFEERVGMKIPEYFALFGEEAFRKKESEIIEDVSKYSGKIIATGGGAVLKSENVRALKRNGKLFFLDRPLECLIPTSDRPLASDKDALFLRYSERYGIYTSAADVIITAECDANFVAEKIGENL